MSERQGPENTLQAATTLIFKTFCLIRLRRSHSRHFSSQNISVKQHCPSPLSVCTMCVCGGRGGGGGAPLAVMLEPLLMSPLCVSLLLLFFNILFLDVHYACSAL